MSRARTFVPDRVPGLWCCLLLVLAVGSMGCEPRRAQLIDLDKVAELADLRSPTSLIEVEAPEFLPVLIGGWSLVKVTLPDGGGARWSLGDDAEVEFFLGGRVGEIPLAFRCTSVVPVSDPSGDEVRIELNGQSWTSIRLRNDLEEFQLTMPASLLRRGENRLRFIHPPSPRSRVERSDTRVLWDWIRVGPALDQEGTKFPPQVTRREDGTFFLGLGQRLDFFLEIPEGAGVRVDQIRERAGGAALQVGWQPKSADGSDREAPMSPLDSDEFLPLTPAGSGRLSLFATGAQDVFSAGNAGLWLSGIEILGPDSRAPQQHQDEQQAKLPSGERPNVLIYLVDTLRRDRLGCYGYERPTTPRIDAFASEAVRYADALAQSSWTRSSVASIFTGMWPQDHGANRDDEKLGSSMPVLAEILTQAGYRSFGFTANGNVSRAFGFDRGFERYVYLAQAEGAKPGHEIAFTSREINDRVFSWLDTMPPAQPFFLYVHTVDPHAPYDPPEPFRSQFVEGGPVENRFASINGLLDLAQRIEPVGAEVIEPLLQFYDAEVAANDASFGALVDELKKRGLYANTLVIFVSDHGEEFFEHQDWTHGKHIYSEVMDIPLIIKPPGKSGGGRVVDHLAQHVDLLPTILEVVGLPLVANLPGRSLRSHWVEPQVPDAKWSTHAVTHLDLRERLFTGLVDGKWQLIQRRPDHNAFPELYDRVADPQQRHDLAPRLPQTVRRLAYLRRLEDARYQAHGADAVDPAAQAEAEAGLRALGYLQ